LINAEETISLGKKRSASGRIPKTDKNKFSYSFPLPLHSSEPKNRMGAYQNTCITE